MTPTKQNAATSNAEPTSQELRAKFTRALEELVAEIREVINGADIPANIQDLHVWRVGKGKYACVISIAASTTTTPDEIRKLLSVHEELVHITVEINQATHPQ